MNLTAITEENDVVNKHFMDSITLGKYIRLNGRRDILATALDTQ